MCKMKGLKRQTRKEENGRSKPSARLHAGVALRTRQAKTLSKAGVGYDSLG